jgi:glycolate oxidase FAD binding subunit
MKNVAGYDLSRVLAGSMGTLGVICEVSLKVLPVAPATLTLRLEADQASAIRRLNEWGGQPLPLNASAWWDGMLVLRLAGAGAAVRAAAAAMGGEVIEAAMAAAFWTGLRDHRDEFFVGAAKAVDAGASLWRLSVPATTAPLKLSGEQLLEWVARSAGSAPPRRPACCARWRKQPAATRCCSAAPTRARACLPR